MKKIFIILIAAALILTLFACGEKKDPDATTGTGEASELATGTGEPTETDEETGTDLPVIDVDPLPDGDANPEGIPDAADHTVDHVVTYTDQDGNVIREETIPATGHVWVYESDESGHRQVCALCGAVGETAAHDPDGAGTCRVCGYGCEHAFTDSVVSPGCTTAGYTVRTCSKCGYAYSSDYVNAAGHRYSRGVETPASCTENGSYRFTCAVCGSFFVEKDAIPATGHNYVNGVCVNCGQSEPQEVSVIVDDPDVADDTEDDGPVPFWTGEVYELPEVPIG